LKKKKNNKPKLANITHPNTSLASTPFAIPNTRIAGIIIAIFAFVLYAQSVTFDFVLDDQASITANTLVQEGFKAIPKLMVTDSWHGNNLGVKIPIYRPGSFVLFAIEWQLFKDSPAVYHLVNVILYALTCWLLFMLLSRLMTGWNILFPFMAALLFTAHPIHTEVVANIKSADEIFCFLFALLASLAAWNYSQDRSPLQLILMAVFYFVSVFSKETGIVFVICIPMMLYFFTKSQLKTMLTISGVLVAVVIPYFLLRTYALQGIPAYEHSPLVNAAYATTDFVSQRATALGSLLKYESLLVFPHPLSYNYDYAHITVKSIANPFVLFSSVLQLVALGYAFFLFSKKHILSFAILFFFFTMAPIANIFIIIASTLGERLLYIPSLGFCLALTWILFKISKVKLLADSLERIKDSAFLKPVLIILASVVLLLYTTKTLTRSADWKDNVALFGHDVKIVPQSATARYHWGNALLSQLYPNEQDPARKEAYLKAALIEYQAAIDIYPRFPDAVLHIGDAYNKLGDVDKAITYMESYNQLTQNSNPDMLRYLAQLYGQAGQQDKGIAMYKNMLTTGSPNNAEIYYSVGYFYNQKQDYNNAIIYFDSCLLYNPGHQSALTQKIIADLNIQHNDDAIASSEKLLSLDPQNQKVYTYLGVAYTNLGNLPKAIEALQKAIQLDPNDEESKSRLKILEDFQKTKPQ
jgi:tetratricopeptide (TPR) repeat protein